MHDFIVLIKRLFGVYEDGYEYWVKLDSIKIPDDFKKAPIGKEKWKRKINYWLKTGKFESRILLDRDFNLIDGYSSVKIAQVKGIEKVPVYFI